MSASAALDAFAWAESPAGQLGIPFAVFHLLVGIAMLIAGTSAPRGRENLPHRLTGAFIGAGLGLGVAIAEAALAGLFEDGPAALVGPLVMLPFFMGIAGTTAVAAFSLAGSRALAERPGGSAHLVLIALVVGEAGAYAVSQALGKTSPALFLLAAAGCSFLGAGLRHWRLRQELAAERQRSVRPD